MGRLPEAGRETPCFFCCFLGYPEHNPHLARSYPWGHLASPTRWEAAVFYYREQVPTETAPRDVVLTWQISDRCPGSSILPPGPPWGRGGWRTGLPPLPAWFPTEPVVLLYPFCGSYPCVSVVLVIQNALVACGGGGLEVWKPCASGGWTFALACLPSAWASHSRAHWGVGSGSTHLPIWEMPVSSSGHSQAFSGSWCMYELVWGFSSLTW